MIHNLKLFRLDYDKCYEYISNAFEGSGYFANKLSHSNLIKEGNFYCLAPHDVDERLLYEFKTGWVVFPNQRTSDQLIVENVSYSDPIILSMTNKLLKDDYGLLLEDYSGSPTDQYIIQHDFKYYLVNQTMIYLINKSYKEDDMMRYYYMANSYLFLPILFKDNSAINPIPKNEIGKDIENHIFNNMSCFFTEVYDGESFLIWINKDSRNIVNIINDSLSTYNKNNKIQD